MLFIKKYKPLHLIDFYLDDSILNLIHTLLNIDYLNILFVGDSSCGKTTLIEAIMREYYSGHKNYKQNILTINNLKEQGIHYYRNDVKQFCQSSSGIKNKKKMVFLDDMDFINEQSQQVFRNSIDKYNHNIHFIASCSNIQKIIETLQSRFIIIKLKPFTRVNLSSLFYKIKNNENLQFENKQVEDFILDISYPSAKTLINYMEKFKLLNEPVYDMKCVEKLCTNIHFSLFDSYIQSLREENIIYAIHILYNLIDNGYSVMDVLDNFFIFIKVSKQLKEEEKYNIIPIICKYISIFHNLHEDEIELAIFTNELYNIFHSSTKSKEIYV